MKEEGERVRKDKRDRVARVIKEVCQECFVYKKYIFIQWNFGTYSLYVLKQNNNETWFYTQIMCNNFIMIRMEIKSFKNMQDVNVHFLLISIAKFVLKKKKKDRIFFYQMLKTS